jgi:hypothetical protein
MCNVGAEVCIREKMRTGICKSKSLHVGVGLGERMSRERAVFMMRRDKGQSWKAKRRRCRE